MSKPTIPEASVKTTTSSEESNDKEVKSLYDQISLLDINELSEEEIINKLKSILGTSLTINITNKIKLLLYKEFIIYNKMLLEATDDFEIEEIRTVLASIKTKIDLLDDLEELEDEQEVEESITANNNIFFLLSDNGNIVALESLRKHVPRDYYPAFKELIMALKEGKVKNIKRLTRYGILELKDFKIRVLFDRLKNGNYIIIDCFMKKVDTGVSYRNNLSNRASKYHDKKDFYLSEINKPEFIKKHEGYLAEVLNLLDSKVLEGVEENETRTI